MYLDFSLAPVACRVLVVPVESCVLLQLRVTDGVIQYIYLHNADGHVIGLSGSVTLRTLFSSSSRGCETA